MDNDLVCNFKKCRKRVTAWAWVTSCSHIFCDEDGSQELEKLRSCPACGTSLPGKYDVRRIDLQPSEQHKSMVLAGYKPETIMEVCSRALAFWTFQTQQERAYQEYVATKAREKNSQLEHYYEQLLTRVQTELTSLKTKLSASQKELEFLKKRYAESAEQLTLKNRQYQKLQAMYDSYRLKSITTTSFESGMISPRITGITSPFHTHRQVHQFEMPNPTSAHYPRRPESRDFALRHLPSASGDAHLGAPHSPPQRDFILKPNSTPLPASNVDNNLW